MPEEQQPEYEVVRESPPAKLVRAPRSWISDALAIVKRNPDQEMRIRIVKTKGSASSIASGIRRGLYGKGYTAQYAGPFDDNEFRIYATYNTKESNA